ncbi:hypothetical protein BSZ37_19360 [Rubrivirga marina]|uniref:Uncharacterized protein n=1 Tax=Rubrivirga marina TaxID=1196024 RepID=A0A271J550_9BACT|nr:hypothetical protein BSZ37_19360 [Rubrivirga marina]
MIALVALAGCDSEDSLLGEFVGRVEVDAEARAVDGEAVYTVVETASGPEFVLGLFVGDLYESDYDAYDYVLFRRPGDRPGVGAYAIADEQDRSVAATIAKVDEADDPLESVGAVLRGVDGTLALTRIDSYGFLAGSFEFDADGLTVTSPTRRVGGAAQGTFEARYVPPATFRRLGLDLGI